MKRIVLISFRAVISVLLLAGLLVYIVPSNARTLFAGLQHQALILTFLLMPLFLFCRILKWHRLITQHFETSNGRLLIEGYLKGMALGMFTPGRSGEVTRSLHLGNTPLLVLLFMLEKLVEIFCLLFLCLGSLFALQLPLLVQVLTVFLFAAGLVSMIVLRKRLLLMKAPKNAVAKYLWSKGWADYRQRLCTTRLFDCTVLSLLCFLLFMTQVYLILRGFGTSASVHTILLFPVVLLSNWVPLTIGGFGLREAAAAWLLNHETVSAAAAAGSFLVVSLIDLMLPAILGALLFLKRPLDTSPSQGAADEQWDSFWETRNRSVIGRVLAWGRRTFVTPHLVRYIHQHTQAGTLIEAGCGTGEIAIRTAALRGDQLLLIDISENALLQAAAGLERAGIPGKVLACDLHQLQKKVGYIRDGTTFNIGVVEHFPDCSTSLQQMAAISGNGALAVIPERSLFWSVFIQISTWLKLVPDDFYIHLYREEELVKTVRDAGLCVCSTSRIRILGLIPYLGVQFREVETMKGTES